MIEIIPGVWGIENDSHHNGWIVGAGKLTHDQNVLPLLEPYLKPGGQVIDGGSYIGTHARFYLDQVGPTGDVYCFEPNPFARECLLANCPEAIVYPYGLGDFQTTAKLVLPSDYNFGATRLREWTVEEGGLSDADIVTIDSMDLEPTFIKLDIEGFEFKALLGARDTIKLFKPVMLVEANESTLAAQGKNSADLLDLIRSFNYEVSNIFPRNECGGPMFDALCLPL